MRHTRAVEIRPYRDTDRDDVYDICVRTADGGGDARGMYSSDDLMPDLFAGPYLHLEPELAFVLDDGTRAVGYVLGTANTARWAERHRAEWLPRVADRYPLPAGEPSTPEESLVDLLHHPERNVHPELADHPAHLHIDLLPGSQGAGHGRALIRTYLAALRERGVPAVHLGMLTANTPARAFYDRLGFRELPFTVPDVTYLGAPTSLAV